MAEKMIPLVEVEALRAVKHGGVYFEPGDVLELSASDAKELLALGAVSLLAPEPVEASGAEAAHKSESSSEPQLP